MSDQLPQERMISASRYQKITLARIPGWSEAGELYVTIETEWTRNAKSKAAGGPEEGATCADGFGEAETGTGGGCDGDSPHAARQINTEGRWRQSTADGT